MKKYRVTKRFDCYVGNNIIKKLEFNIGDVLDIKNDRIVSGGYDIIALYTDFAEEYGEVEEF